MARRWIGGGIAIALLLATSIAVGIVLMRIGARESPPVAVAAVAQSHMHSTDPITEKRPSLLKSKGDSAPTPPALTPPALTHPLPVAGSVTPPKEPNATRTPAKAIVFKNVETAAIIDRTNMPVGPLFEARMLATAKLDWVERSRIEQVFAEQSLQTFFSAEAGAQRAALGRTLKADVLAIVRSRNEKASRDAAGNEGNGKVLDLVVFESQRGLRLASYSMPASGDPANDSDALSTVFTAALEKLSEKITHVFAVPTFVSQDLEYRYQYLSAAYSKHLERHLQHRKGVLLVELAEAKSLAGEAAISATSLERPLPLYVLGEYRNDGKGDERRMRLTLKVQRGDTVVATRTRERLDPSDATMALLAMCDEVTNQALSENVAPTDALDRAAEIKQLAERARRFEQNGEWGECVGLLEAAFLLDPNLPDLRMQAAHVYTHIADLHRARAQHNMAEAVRTMQALHRATEHLEVGCMPRKKFDPPLIPDLREHLDPFPSSEFMGTLFSTRGFVGFAQENAEFAAYFKEEIAFRRRVFLDLFRARARAGYGDEWRFFLYLLERGDVAQVSQTIRSLVQELKDLPHAKERTIYYSQNRYGMLCPELQQDPTYLTDLENDSNPDLRAAAAFLRENMTKQLKQQEEYRARVAKSRDQPDDLKDAPTRQVSLMVAGGNPKDVGKELKRPFSHCIPLGPGHDLFLCGSSFYLMREKGKLLQLIEGIGQSHFACYDGRFAWICIKRYQKTPSLIVLDPVTTKMEEITAEHGLPIVPHEQLADPRLQQYFIAAPVRPGRVLLAGTFGRSWIATADYDPSGLKKVKVFFEARDATVVQSGGMSWKDTNVAFEPDYAFTLRSQSGEQRIVFGRNWYGGRNYECACHPLLVDPESKAVTVCQDSIHWSELEAGVPRDGSVLISHFNGLGGPHHLKRFEFPGRLAIEEIMELPGGAPIIVGDDIFVRNDVSWFVGSISKKKIARVGLNNLSPAPNQYAPQGAGYSHHYGYLLEAPYRGNQPVVMQIAADALKEAPKTK
jgi:hypothetical protein